MFSLKLRNGVFLLSLALVGSLNAIGQDLGSSNKLFGGNKSTSKNPSAKPKQKPTKRPTARKPAESKKKVTKPKVVKRPAVKTPKADSSVPTITARDVAPVRTAPKVVVQRSALEMERYEELIDQGNSARDDRNYAAAEAAYLAAQKLDPRDARAFVGMGNLYSDQQRWENAEKAFRSAVALEKNFVELLTALSFVLTRPLMAPNISERYAEAEALARQAIKLDANSALAYDALGVALEMQGQTGSETETAYRRSMQLDRDFAPAYAHLGRLMRKLGRTAEANAAYREAATRAITVGTKLLVADTMHSDQRYADSQPILDLALRLDTKNPTALTMLGRANTVLGKYADAERYLMRSIDVAPASPIGYELLSTLRLRQGRLDEAESSLNRSVAYLAPFEKRRVASLYELIGDAYSKAGRSINARRAYAQARSLDSERETLKSKLARM
ncbi:MAG: tetratricopeptide repeat protein [Blastocatellia bacterium]|nr:tetratricopeptide repeat protein [Blastocatellia bacterium]